MRNKLTLLSSSILLATGLFVVALVSVASIGPSSSHHSVNAKSAGLQINGIQADIFADETITTTAKSEVVACAQGDGDIGRKTFVIENASASSGTLTVTVELRDRIDGTDFTSGYVSHLSIPTDTLTYTAKIPSTDIAARYCNVSAYSASTSTITVSMRKE
jgi:hypothetical protein